MDLTAILKAVSSGDLSVEDARVRLSAVAPAERDLEFARVDLDREERCGVPEVIFGEGKTAEQIVAIVQAQRDAGQPALVTRIDADKAAGVRRSLPEADYAEAARLLWWGSREGAGGGDPELAVISAGTSDLGVAEEAALTAEWLGRPVDRVYDVGVAGLSRLLKRLDRIRRAQVVIVVAGMDGALPSVVAGQVSAPVIAVPTRVGYGWNLDGVSAFLSMINSCAAGVTAVNLDNGFGAGVAAVKMLGVRGGGTG